MSTMYQEEYEKGFAFSSVQDEQRKYLTPDEDQGQLKVSNRSKKHRTRGAKPRIAVGKAANNAVRKLTNNDHYAPITSDSDEALRDANSETDVSNYTSTKANAPKFYKPRRISSSESIGDYKRDFPRRVNTDKQHCMRKIHLAFRKSPRRPLGKTVPQVDFSSQTESQLLVDKNCQAVLNPNSKVDCKTKLVQAELMRKKQEQDMCVGDSFLNATGKPEYKDVFTTTTHWSQNRQNICSSECKSHPFPFAGKSPSGKIKINEEMIVYEDSRLSVVVASPEMTKVRHKKWLETDNPVPDPFQSVSDEGQSNDCEDNICTPTEEYNDMASGLFGHSTEATKWKSKLRTLQHELLSCQLQGSEVASSGNRSQQNSPELLTSQNRKGEEKRHFPSYMYEYENKNVSNFLGKRNSSSPPMVPPLPSLDETYDRNERTFGSLSHREESASSSRNTFLQNLHYRIQKAIHPDTKVVIGGREFPVHLVALQTHSSYFDTLRRPQEGIYKVELPESVVSPEDFQSIMDWLLSDEKHKALAVHKSNVVRLYSASQFLGISELKEQCRQFVKEKVQEEDPKLIKMWEEANNRARTKDLVAILAQKLTKLFPKLYETGQFLKLEVNELATLLDSDELIINSELEVFDAAVRWLLFDWENRKRHAERVMFTVRFGLLTPLQLTQIEHLYDDDAYKKIFSLDKVKKMVSDGRTFAILKTHYGRRSIVELNEWVEKTHVEPPKPRLHLDPDIARDVTVDDYTIRQSEKAPEEKNFFPANNDVAFATYHAAEVDRSEMGPLKQKNSLHSLQILTNEYSPQGGMEIRDVDEEPAKSSSLQLRDILTSIEPSYAAVVSNNPQPEDSQLLIKKNQVEAATTIQKFARGFLVRKHMAKMKDAAKTIQNALHVFRQTQNSNTRSNSSANSIGSPGNSTKASQQSIVPEHPDVNLVSPSKAKLLPNLDVAKGVILLMGGANPKVHISEQNTASDVYLFFRDINLWKHVGQLPEPRSHFGLGRVGNDVFVVGGSDPRYKTVQGKFMAVKTVWQANLRSGQWLLGPVTPRELDEARSQFGCVAKDGEIYVIGGADRDSRALSSCQKFNPRSNSWTKIASLSGPRLSMGITVFNDHIWVAGGISKDPKTPVLRSVVYYDTITDRLQYFESWTSTTPLPLPRGFTTLVSIDQKIYVVGGAGIRHPESKVQTSLPDVLCYKPEKNTWVEIGLLTMPRHAHVAIPCDGKIFIIGGVNSNEKAVLKSVEVFDLKTHESHEVRYAHQRMTGVGALALD